MSDNYVSNDDVEELLSDIEKVVEKHDMTFSRIEENEISIGRRDGFGLTILKEYH